MDNNQLSFEAAKTIYNSSNNKEVLEALETIFPQLRESEDEKVRKELIMFIKKRDRSGCDYDYDKWLTWLEKQSEKKDNNKLIWKHWSTGIAGNGDGKPIYLIKHYNTYSISSCLSSECDYILLSDLDKLISNEDNKKIINKNEPKFKVGDWVVNKYGDIWHIDSLDKKNYQVSNKGRYNYFPIAKQDEMHLWTIEDAKPGDLLFISTKQRNYWAMFKEYDDNNKFIFFYCYICGDFNIGGFVPIDCINKINPLPFSPHSGRFYNTMKKAGYEWDDLNNKLVNINPDLQKFYTGDWVICTDQGGYEHIRQITNVEIFTPAFDSKQCHRYWTSDLTWFGDSYDARLWTLDDAKDGDVLVDDDNNIFIFDGTVEEGKYPFAYCGLTAQGFDSYDIRLPFTHNNNIHPATWEQRNLLFKKMKEAGYEWDDEKKELKKIDTYCQNNCKGFQETGKCFADGDCEAKKNVQIINKDDALLESAIAFIESSDKFCEWKGNSKKDVLDWIDSLKHRVQQKQEWTEEDIRNIENIDSVLFYDKDLPEDTCMRLRNWLQSLKPNKDMIEALRTEYEKGRADTLSEMKSSWSEEDEDAIGMAIIALEDMYDEDTPNTTYGGYNLPFNKAAERLKSIKDRVQPKPMQEWKQENIEELTEFENAMMHIGGSFFGENAGLDPNDTDTIKEQAELLLELAPKQEWSEEDEEYINDLIGVFDGQQYQAHSDEEVVNWLKSIRLQCNKEWGERDEEMLKSIIATCELACEDRDSSPARHLLKMQTNWLKSLRPQKQWKPSNEQIEALENLVRSYGESGTLSPYDNNTKQLYSLLYDLKNI